MFVICNSVCNKTHGIFFVWVFYGFCVPWTKLCVRTQTSSLTVLTQKTLDFVGEKKILINIMAQQILYLKIYDSSSIILNSFYADLK